MEVSMQRHSLAALVSAFVLALPLADAAGQMRQGPGRGMMGDQCEPGMGMMCMMGGQPRMMHEGMARRAEQHLAALKTQLKITDAQTKEWDSYAAAVRDAAKGMSDHFAAMRERMRTATLQQRLELHEAMLAIHLEQLRKTKQALTALYAVLSDDQKKIADSATMGPTGRHHRRGPRTQ
jgi:hypothetical protein